MIRLFPDDAATMQERHRMRLTPDHCLKRADECQQRAQLLSELPRRSWQLLAERFYALADQLQRRCAALDPTAGVTEEQENGGVQAQNGETSDVSR